MRISVVVPNDTVRAAQLQAQLAEAKAQLATLTTSVKGARGARKVALQAEAKMAAAEVKMYTEYLAGMCTHVDLAAALLRMEHLAFRSIFADAAEYAEKQAAWLDDTRRNGIAYHIAWGGDDAVALAVRWQYGEKFRYNVLGAAVDGFSPHPQGPPTSVVQLQERVIAFRAYVLRDCFSKRASSSGYFHRAVEMAEAEALKRVYEKWIRCSQRVRRGITGKSGRTPRVSGSRRAARPALALSLW